MPTDINSLKTNLLSLVGASLSIDGWDDAVLGEALGQGLADAVQWLPPVEASFTVAAATQDQDLTTLAPLQILAVAYPWNASANWQANAVPWRPISPGVIALNTAPTIGQTLRVRYRKGYTVNGIGGAVSTTLPATAERSLLLAAAGHAYLIRYRQLSRRPSTAPSDLKSCQDLAETYRKQFLDLLGWTGSQAPAWPGIGL